MQLRPLMGLLLLLLVPVLLRLLQVPLVVPRGCCIGLLCLLPRLLIGRALLVVRRLLLAVGSVVLPLLLVLLLRRLRVVMLLHTASSSRAAPLVGVLVTEICRLIWLLCRLLLRLLSRDDVRLS